MWQLKCPYGKSTTEFTSENDRLFVKHGFACIPCVDESSPEDSPEQGKTYQEDSDKDEGLVIRFDPLHWKDEGRDAEINHQNPRSKRCESTNRGVAMEQEECFGTKERMNKYYYLAVRAKTPQMNRRLTIKLPTVLRSTL